MSLQDGIGLQSYVVPFFPRYYLYTLIGLLFLFVAFILLRIFLHDWFCCNFVKTFVSTYWMSLLMGCIL